LRVVEDFLTMLISRGFSDDRAVMACRIFSSFLLGHLLLEASLLGAQTSPGEEPGRRAKSFWLVMGRFQAVGAGRGW
jgi:hypothetical protein